MPTVKLERRKFVPNPGTSMGRREVLVRAAEKLNYKPISLIEELRLKTEREQQEIVAKALEELGIEPLDRKAVEAYKAEEKRKIDRKGSSRFVKFMHSASQNTVGALTIGLFTSFIIGLAVVLGAQDHRPFKYPRLDLGVCVWVLSLVAALTICMIARHKRCTTFSGMWKAENLQNYRSPIPEFVLERALQIQARLPETSFGIEWLEETYQNVPTSYTPPDPDPFLFMVYGKVGLYLDVWDEPKFEGRRTI